MACFQGGRSSPRALGSLSGKACPVYPTGLSLEPSEIKYVTVSTNCEVRFIVSSIKQLKYFASPSGHHIGHNLVLKLKW